MIVFASNRSVFVFEASLEPLQSVFSSKNGKWAGVDLREKVHRVEPERIGEPTPASGMVKCESGSTWHGFACSRHSSAARAESSRGGCKHLVITCFPGVAGKKGKTLEFAVWSSTSVPIQREPAYYAALKCSKWVIT